MKHNFNAFVKENEAAELRLKKVNQDFIGDLMDAISCARVSIVQREAIHKDLIGMAAECEQRKETLESALGEEPQAWCRRVIAESARVSGWMIFLEIVLETFSLYAFVAGMGLWLGKTLQVGVYSAFWWVLWGMVSPVYHLFLRPRFAAYQDRRRIIKLGIGAMVLGIFVFLLIHMGSQRILFTMPSWLAVVITVPPALIAWILLKREKNRQFTQLVGNCGNE